MAITKDEKLRLSPSALNVFLECPKCFWLGRAKGIHRPRGIFPSLPGGMDLLIKTYFDKYRNVGKVPPEIEEKIDKVKLFPDVELLNKWRNWRTGLTYEDSESGTTLFGALDDLGIVENQYVPLDYKTRGFDVKPGGESFYKNQLNCYSLLLRENNMPIAGYSYLIYYIPKEVSEKGMTRFDVVPKKVEVDPEAALQVLREATSLINGPMPKTHSQCEYCSWGNDFIVE